MPDPRQPNSGTDRRKGGRTSESEAEARRILSQINAETAATGLPRARNMLDRAGDHFAGADADPDDKAEVWGRRIGRGIGLALLIYLVIWLIRFVANAP